MTQTDATSAPAPPALEIDPSNDGNLVSGKILTNDHFPLVLGTAASGGGSIELQIDSADDAVLPFIPLGSARFAGFAMVSDGIHALTVVQLVDGEASGPSDTITVYELPVEVAGVSTVPLTVAEFESLLAQGFQLRPSPFTQAFQLRDGVIGVGGSGTGSDDTINLTGSSEITLGAGSDTINNNGFGTDTIFASAATAETVINQETGSILFFGGNSPAEASLR